MAAGVLAIHGSRSSGGRQCAGPGTGGGVVAGAHAQGECGVVGVGEPVHCLQGHDSGGVGPGEGVVQDAAASDCGELVPVANQRDPRPGLVGDHQERSGGVLVEHARLVDEQQVTGSQPGGWARCVVGVPCPVPVVVPAPAVLVDQPGRGVALGAGLRGGDLGRLQRRRHHQQPVPLPSQQGLRRPQRGGLARTGRALDDHQVAVTGQGAHDGSLGGVDPRQPTPLKAESSGGSLGAAGEADAQPLRAHARAVEATPGNRRHTEAGDECLPGRQVGALVQSLCAGEDERRPFGHAEVEACPRQRVGKLAAASEVLPGEPCCRIPAAGQAD